MEPLSTKVLFETVNFKITEQSIVVLRVEDSITKSQVEWETTIDVILESENLPIATTLVKYDPIANLPACTAEVFFQNEIPFNGHSSSFCRNHGGARGSSFLGNNTALNDPRGPFGYHNDRFPLAPNRLQNDHIRNSFAGNTSSNHPNRTTIGRHSIATAGTNFRKPDPVTGTVALVGVGAAVLVSSAMKKRMRASVTVQSPSHPNEQLQDQQVQVQEQQQPQEQQQHRPGKRQRLDENNVPLVEFCIICERYFTSDKFSDTQWRKEDGIRCYGCLENGNVARANDNDNDGWVTTRPKTQLCVIHGRRFTRDKFLKTQFDKKEGARCCECIDNNRTVPMSLTVRPNRPETPPEQQPARKKSASTSGYIKPPTNLKSAAGVITYSNNDKTEPCARNEDNNDAASFILGGTNENEKMPARRNHKDGNESEAFINNDDAGTLVTASDPTRWSKNARSSQSQ